MRLMSALSFTNPAARGRDTFSLSPLQGATTLDDRASSALPHHWNSPHNPLMLCQHHIYRHAGAPVAGIRTKIRLRRFKETKEA